MRQYFQVFAIITPLVILALSILWPVVLWMFAFIIPSIGLGLIDMFQTKQAIRRLYPVFGRFRYLLESVRPEIQQYFVKSDTNGAPIPREFCSLVYQRACKIFSVLHLLRVIALGADTANSAREMMMALGCIQARSCNTDKCPTGIATQDTARSKGLVVSDKATRVANFHRATVENLAELLAAAGLDSLEQLEPRHFNHRVHVTSVKTYAHHYLGKEAGCAIRRRICTQ